MSDFDKDIREVYEAWHKGVESNVPTGLGAVFKLGMHYLGQLCDKKNYAKAISVLKTMQNAFNIDN